MTQKSKRTKRVPDRAASGGSKLRRTVAAGETERVAVWLTREVAQRLRILAARERMSLSVAVEEAVRAYLAGKA